MSKNSFVGEVINVYTRAQAIEDGVLVDVSETAREAGIVFPVAVTNGVWEEYIAWTEKDTKRQTYQDTNGRLWDVLFMLYFAIRKMKHHSDIVFYQLYVVPRDGKTSKPKLTKLKCVVSAGDDQPPVMTVMLPDED